MYATGGCRGLVCQCDRSGVIADMQICRYGMCVSMKEMRTLVSQSCEGVYMLIDDASTSVCLRKMCSSVGDVRKSLYELEIY